MVDLTGYFWNQIREQLTSWYKEFSGSVIGQGIITAKL